ncbi:chitin deacetylase 1 isoform X2 [Tribolium madens]|uniref:chitin deacetylase 1 isoform X2 n=1 Tax=Tribolium madens TaxID=41895 RepID=UPI001CF75F6D|nr:chitin deacetylase 1 isoform X2 [Tribolium madens]
MAFNKFVTFFHTVFYLLGLFIATQSEKIKCVENGRFYRDPDRPPHKVWTSSECSKYYLCIDGEVFDFRCSSGLLFDVIKQICDLKINVDNCDITSETITPRPIPKCPNNHQGCTDGTCLPQNYFCDGSVDCLDGSDERFCDPKNDPYGALECNSSCALPECFCSHDGTQIPGNLEPSKVAQMVLLTFDGPINSDNWELLGWLLNGAKNPNGCPIESTFFVSHQHNNYHQTQKLWNNGHEIAVHSVTHRAEAHWWSRNASIEDWFDEMVGEANILHRFSGVRLSDLRGLRAPFLQIGSNRQFLMMKEFGFVYDSSIVAPFTNPPLWPYTLDHKMPHECSETKQECPTRSYPGIWEVVLNPFEAKDYSCARLDACPGDLSGDDIFKILVNNFKRHYLANRAPFGLHLNTAWLKNKDYFDALQDFIEEILQQPDVWFVTNSQAIKWMQNPTSVDQLDSFKEWNCDKVFKKHELACKVPNVCKLYSRIFQQERYLYTCFQCPLNYPWIRNEFGLD